MGHTPTTADRRKLAHFLREVVRTIRALAVLVALAVLAAVVIANQPLKVNVSPLGEGDPIARLIEAHGCWIAAGPEGVTPKHAVATLPGAEPALVSAEVGFGIWLENRPGVLHAFCR